MNVTTKLSYRMHERCMPHSPWHWLVAAGLITAIVGGTAVAAQTSAPWVIDADYPGGNIIVEECRGNLVQLRQDLRDTGTWWFYWNFRVRQAAGETLTFQFKDASPIGVRGPAISRNGGESWHWLGSEAVDGNSFQYQFPAGAEEVRFAFAMPYQHSDLDQFIASHAGAKETGRLLLETLCPSRQGHDVPLLRVSPSSGRVRQRMLITARHHACESMASYVLEGMLDRWLTVSQDANHPMHDVEVVVVPMVDYDGVQDGDQGKNREPRDHNRDYDGDGLYPETRAIRKLPAMSPQVPVTVAIDLHCPWIRGPHNEEIYMVGSSREAIATEQEKLGMILQASCQSPLKYHLSANIPFGTAWNTAANYKQGTSFSRWATNLEGIRLATTFEIPYANAGGVPVTAESARAFGRDLARAVAKYLSQADN